MLPRRLESDHDHKVTSYRGKDGTTFMDDNFSFHSITSTTSENSQNSLISRFGPVISGDNDAISDSEQKFGTLDGVYLPCIQNILGVILFIRLTSITAQAGCFQTTLIILMCVTSTFPTVLSLSAIATNGTIEAGGPYYVISRTLGPEIGGAIGLLFYIGTTGSAAMYVLGAVEALEHLGLSFLNQNIYHSFEYWTQVVALVIMFSITSVVTVGERYVAMSSNFFLFCVLTSIFCMSLGAILFALGWFSGNLAPMDRLFMDNIWPMYEPDPTTEISPTFFSLLAIFYPSVTGILAGSTRSAVLSDPARSIPAGTLAAIGTTTFIYIFTVWLFGITIANSTMKENKLVVADIAYPSGFIVKIGIIMSSIGAALQCMSGAKSLLAAIALDDSMSFLRFVKPMNNTVQPNRAIWLTCLIASVATLSGNLDHITPIITMFFLLMYSAINVSCFLLDVTKAPSFRPTFRYFHWSISLFAFLWCLGLALIISWYTAILTFVLFLLLYLYNKKQQLDTKDWGDVGSTLHYSTVMQSLRALSSSGSIDFHAKNWRPQLLTLVNTNTKGNPIELHVLRLASQLNKGRGINMVFCILQGHGSLDNLSTFEKVTNARLTLRRHMDRELMEGFEEVIATTGSKSEAIWSAVIHSGLGPLSPNTIMLSWPTDWQKNQSLSDEFISTVRGIMNLKKALLVFKGGDRYPCSSDLIKNGSIDVWWVVHDGGLLLLLPYLLLQNHIWKNGSKLRVYAVITSTTENPELLWQAVTEHLQRVRISASVTVVDLSHTDIAEDMRELDSVPVEGVDIRHSANKNTQHMTVGEVFSHEVYDIPYRPVGDLESAIGAELGHMQPDSALTPDKTQFISTGDGEYQAAREFNNQLMKYSAMANLVVTNMPLIRSDVASKFLGYVDVMTKGIDNVLLIRGSGAEVITTYA